MNNRGTSLILFGVPGAAILFVAIILLTPLIIRTIATSHINRIETRYNLAISYEALHVHFPLELELTEVSVVHAATGSNLTAASAAATLHPFSALQGNPISRARIQQLQSKLIYGDKSYQVTTDSIEIPTTDSMNTAAATIYPAAYDIHLQIERDASDGSMHIQSRGSIGTPNAPGGSWDMDVVLNQAGTVQGYFHAHTIQLDRIAHIYGQPYDSRIHNGNISIRLMADTSETANRSLLRGSVHINDLQLHLPQIADENIDSPDIQYIFTAELDPDSGLSMPNLYTASTAEQKLISAETTRGSITVQQGELRIGTIQADVRPSFHGLRSAAGWQRLPTRTAAKVLVPATSLQHILNTIPVSLLGELVHIEVDGTLAWDFTIEFPTSEVSRMWWTAETDINGFVLQHIPTHLNPFHLRNAFLHRITDEQAGYERVIRIPPMRRMNHEWFIENDNLTEEAALPLLKRTPAPAAASVTRSQGIFSHRLFSGDGSRYHDSSYIFAPLNTISPYLVRAVVTAEDGEFFRHGGFNWRSVRTAIERNVRSREYAVGASTISMQLAKNLFLDHSRLMSRKLQETLLVVLMEQAAAIPKDRIIEIYLNIVEFGPGIYGVHDAAEYYFGKEPMELTPMESVWLASILPAPKRFHHYYDVGEISDAWLQRMNNILEIMLLRNRIDEETYSTAINTKPSFAFPEDTTDLPRQ